MPTAGQPPLPPPPAHSTLSYGQPAPPSSPAPLSLYQQHPHQQHPQMQAPTTKEAADRIVLEYLRRRGFKSAEAAFLTHSSTTSPTTTPLSNPGTIPSSTLSLDDADVDDSLRQVLLLLRDPSQLSDAVVMRFSDSFQELRDWVDGSLDVYKPQLSTCLYPLLIHSFLEMIRRDHAKQARQFLQSCIRDFTDSARTMDGSTRADCIVRMNELRSLIGIASLQHIEENEIAKLYLNNRYEIYMSYHAFELIMAFLSEDARRTVLLRILNQRCRIRFDAASDGLPFVGFRTGTNPINNADGGAAMKLGDETNADGKNKVGIVAEDETDDKVKDVEILWGRLRPESFIMSDVESVAMKVSATKAKRGKQNEDKKKSSLNSTASSPPAKGDKNKDTNRKDGAGPSAGAGAMPTNPLTGSPGGGGREVGEEEEEAVVLEDGTISRSRIPLRRYRAGAAGLQTAADLQARARLRTRDAVDNGIRKDLAILFYTVTNARHDGLNCCAVSEDGAQLAGGCGDSSVRVWDARASGTPGSDSGGLHDRATRLIGHSGPVYGVDWTTCGRFIISCGEDGMIRLWNVGLKSELISYRGHNFPVWDVKFSPIDHYFVSASHDRTARVWSTDRIHPLRVFAGHLSDVDCVAWHPNVNYVATGGADRCVRIWDVRDGQCARLFRGGGGGGGINAVTFAPDGRTVAAGGDGGVVSIWDLRGSGTECIKELRGHRSAVWSLDYSKEGAILASGGADWRVCAWRAEEWSSVVSDEIVNGGTVDLNTITLNSDPVGSGDDGDGNGNKDSDGDIKMDGDGGKDDVTGDKSDGGGGKGKNDASKGKKNSGGGGNSIRGGAVGDGEEGDKLRWNGVPLVEAFETKETPVQMVKFTRRNLLVAAGTFAS